MNIAVIIPTCRESSIGEFYHHWGDIFDRHEARVHVVYDGDNPKIEITDFGDALKLETRRVDRRFKKLIYTHTDAVRNAGFVEAIKDGADILITLDDDVRPTDNSDPIQQHIDVLQQRVPISWFNPCTNYMRGFPYGVRSEAPVKVSHGVALGCPDFDSVTRLAGNAKPEEYPYRGPIPKGCLSPISGMNLAWTRHVAKYVYFAPMGKSVGFHRFADIWMGIHLKYVADAENFAIYHGGSAVQHDCKSDNFDSLIAEAPGLKENEHFCSGDSKYWTLYKKSREQWEELIRSIEVPF